MTETMTYKSQFYKQYRCHMAGLKTQDTHRLCRDMAIMIETNIKAYTKI
jgi:hypothetical protein